MTSSTSAIDQTAQVCPWFIDPDRPLPLAITVPNGMETGTFRARIWRNDLRGTALATLTATAVGQVVTLTPDPADVDELIPTGHRHFTGYYEIDRHVEDVWVPWLKGPFVVDPRHHRTGTETTTLTVTGTSTAITVTVAGPSITEIGAVIHADPARLVKATYRTTAVSGVDDDGWYLHDGTPVTFDDRDWPVMWEGTADQIPDQGTGDMDLQTGDIAVTRSSTL
jgi:hypothetical protein